MDDDDEPVKPQIPDWWPLHIEKPGRKKVTPRRRPPPQE